MVMQIGEQVDFLRFLPEPQPGRRWRWWLALIVAGPGWIVPGEGGEETRLPHARRPRQG